MPTAHAPATIPAPQTHRPKPMAAHDAVRNGRASVLSRPALAVLGRTAVRSDLAELGLGATAKRIFGAPGRPKARGGERTERPPANGPDLGTKHPPLERQAPDPRRPRRHQEAARADHGAPRGVPPPAD